MKIICHFSTLLFLAKEQSKAEKKGDPEEIRRTKQAHEAYKRLCLKADEMIV